jgi:hypothetical protein
MVPTPVHGRVQTEQFGSEVRQLRTEYPFSEPVDHLMKIGT